MTRRSFYRPALLAGLLLLLLPLAGLAQTGFLHRDHTRIVDGAGRPVQLRGVNLGNWLYNEPWMIGNTSFGMFQDEDGKGDEMATAIQDAVGSEARTAAFYGAWRDNYVTRADIQKITGWGFNSVRVPLDYRLFYDPATGKDVDTGFVYLNRLLGWCGPAHIYVILDMHDMPGGKLGWIKENIYGDPAKQALLAHVWSRIAAHYQDNQWIGGYDLVNEPAVWDAPKLSGLYRTLIAAVRAVDRHHLLIAEGDVWGSRLDLLGLSGPDAVWDANLALSDHAYGSPLDPSPLAGPKGIAARLDLPLWLGEFGYNSNTWNRRIRQWAEQADPQPQGWCLWAYKSSGTWSLTSFAVPDGYHRLQEYWNKKKNDPNAPKPSADDAYAALMALAQGTALDHCTVRRDVVDALTRADFATRAIPYEKGLAIPGRLPAEQYNLGAEGVAYHDTVSTDEAGKGPAGRAWNSGWNGRNDGVDLFPSGDSDDGYDIGGIQPGEWTDYTVLSALGTDTLQIRYSSPEGGQMHLLLNGADLAGPILLPATGGYRTYRTLTVPNVQVKASGPATLRLAFDSAGFNVHWVEFSK